MSPTSINDKTVAIIKDRLIANSETIAVAESVTSGLLQFALSGAENATNFYQGGITTYNLGQKSRHLRIEPVHALSCNCVSEKIAGDMALNVCHLFTSDWGIGITGYASPVPESGNKLFAWYAIACRGKLVMTKKINPKNDEPAKIQQLYVKHLLKDLAGMLK
jgi:nicotinamide-nucleotide amidase